jgi:hypothetical protein
MELPNYRATWLRRLMDPDFLLRMRDRKAAVSVPLLINKKLYCEFLRGIKMFKSFDIYRVHIM